MSNIDDFLSGKSVPADNSSGDEISAFLGGDDADAPRQRRESKATAADYIRAIDSGFSQGVTNLAGGVGTFIQDPAASALSGVSAAAALADRGVTWALNKAGGEGTAKTSDAIQENAQLAARFAAESRDAQAQDPTNLPARFGRMLQKDSERANAEIAAKDQADNPELLAQERNTGEATGFVDNLLSVKDNPLAFAHTLARSVPDMAFGVGAASAAARAGVGLGRVSTVGALSEAGSSAMQGRQGVYQQVSQMPLDTLAKSPRFQDVLKETGDPVQARERLANELADQAALLSGAGTAAGTLLTNRLFGGDATAKTILGLSGRTAVAGAEKMSAKEFAKRVAQDTLEEALQGVPEDTVQYGASVQADPSQKWDPAGSAAQNMAAGLAMGAGGHGFGYAKETYQGANDAGANATAENAGKAPPAQSGQAPSAIDSRAEYAGAAGAASGTQRGSASVETVGVANTSEAAEKALRDPSELSTSLDKAYELDKELAEVGKRQSELAPENGYGPAFDGEREELATKAAELGAQRDDITKSWPVASRGKESSFTTEAGARLDAQYALMDAGDLVTSHDENLSANPMFPKELQPRDRSRQASELQVSGIVQKLDPARLGLSADAANGAPIVGADGLVESGNARTIALKRVYQANGQKAEDYKQFLRNNAEQFGITPDAVDGMQKPVLVRIRSTPVNRAEFARQANASTVQRMSPSEQALSDSKRLTSLEGLNPDEQGDFGSSHDFIRQFMSTMPVTEQSDMIESDGRLSTSGYRRIQNAVLARAYGDSPSLRRMTESMDNNLLNVSKALVRVAPTIAEARERMDAGTLHSADIASDLLAAVEGLSSLKEKGWKVSDELGQGDLTGPKYSPESAALLRFLDENARSPRRIAEFFQRYYEALEQAGDPSQPSMFGDEGPAPTRAGLINSAKETKNGITDENTQRGVAGESAQAADRNGREPQNAPGVQGRDQGDGVAQADASRGQPSKPARPAANDAEGGWVAFPKDSGTLGIPRRDMPQIKGEHRGALVNFLAARGIDNTKGEIDPAKLKATQAEFSSVKVDRFAKSGPVGERSVLISSDNHVLDGHHQWLAHKSLGTDVPFIRLGAPIKELLTAVAEFPSVQQSEGATDSDLKTMRAAAVSDFRDALGDLAELATKHTRAAMLPENTPGLMPTLVKLYDAAVRLVGSDARAAKRWVVQQMRNDARLKTIWNRIGDNLHQKAALQALQAMDKPAQTGLFDSPESATEALQGDLFGSPAPSAAPKREAVKPAAPASYKAYKLTDADRTRLLAQFPPTHSRVIADHITAQSMDHMHLVKDGPATGDVIGTMDKDGMQALVVRINGKGKTEGGKPFHISWSVDPGIKTRNMGDALVKNGFTRLPQSIPLDLSAGVNYTAPMKNLGADQERNAGEADKAFAKRVVDKRPTPISLPEKHSLYFKTDGATVVNISDLVSTKTAEQNAQGGENGAKRMAAAAKGELDTRAPITVMPSDKIPGKYEVVDGNGTLTSVSRYNWKTLPVNIVTRTEGLQAMIEDKVKDEQKSVLLDGRPYVYKGKDGDNFKAPTPSSFIAPDVLERADGYVEKFYVAAPPYAMPLEARAEAERLVMPFLEKAAASKAEFDQKVIDLAKSTGALGQMLAPIKGITRASEKMHQDAAYEGGDMNPASLKDLLRSTVVVGTHLDADAVLGAIAKVFDVVQIKDKTAESARNKQGGYADYTAIVKLPSGVLAEIQINTPQMLAVKQGQGHKLYEVARALPQASERRVEVTQAMREIYDAAFAATGGITPVLANSLDAAKQAKNASSEVNAPARGPAGSIPGNGISESPSSDALNQPLDGMDTYSSPPNPKTNVQPGGKESGTLIGKPLDSNVPELPANGYTGANQPGESDANAQPGQAGDQGEGAGAAQKPAGKRPIESVRNGSVRPNALGSELPGDAGSPAAPVGQAGSTGAGQKPQHGQGTAPGNRPVANAGAPAGRDIPPKSGRNYAFGPDDLTYAGSWIKKAEQNVDAVELLQKLKAEGRDATAAEQATLAKFIGWGSSEMANNLFGPKLAKVAKTRAAYDEAIKSMDALKRDYLNKGGSYRGSYADPGYYQAATALRDAKKIGEHTFPDRITRAELDAAKPDAASQRWLELQERLKAALSKEEWAEASRSTQYAHYTSKAVVQSMWRAMDRMGFKGGSILEPGAGIGVFPGLMPADMAANSVYTGIEFESVTGGILQQLFPDERILVESFVDSKLPKDFYDVAVGNPPFSSTKILGDPEYAKKALSLHDYFFAKSIDRVKPGGLVVYVTSRYTMDKGDDKARAYLGERADLVGAIRLPQTAFQQNAGTEVVTDVIFLRKKVPGTTFEHAQEWAKVEGAKGEDGKPLMISAGQDKDGKDRGDKPALINEYFARHPEMVLGQHSNAGSMYSAKDYTVTPRAGSIEDHFDKAVAQLPADIFKPGRGSSAEAAAVREIDFNPKAKKEGNYYLSDAGELMVREGGFGTRVELKSPKDVALIKSFVPLRDALKQAHYDQLNNGDWEASLKALQGAYETFTKAHGQINQFTSKTVNVKVDELDEDGTPTGKKVADEVVRRTFPVLDVLGDDPDVTLVQALEDLNEDTGKIKPSNFLTERVLEKQASVTVSTPTDALLTVLNDTGKVDIAMIADRLSITPAEAIEALGTSIYEDPSSGWIMADEYLSGNVKRKLELAREALKTDRRFERNVTALEANQPEPLAPGDINPRLGMNWIPSDVYEKFMAEVMGLKMGIEWHPRTKAWVLDKETHSTHHVVDTWGKIDGTFKSLEGAQKSADKKNERYGDSPRFSVRAIVNPIVTASTEEWGTVHTPAEQVMELALTGRPVRVEAKDKEGKLVFDPAATEATKAKLDQMHAKFESWLFSDPARSQRLVQLYNDKFNTTVARKFDGSHLTLPGTSKQFNVFDHVKRGAWRIMQSGNTYLAHAVGSGKTFQMVISAMEQKRLGLIKKPMIVVPNHMLKQFASEWQQLYPAARLMVADERNFHTDNRRRFVSRVALSDLDGVILTHSALKLMDLDPAFKTKMIEEELAFFRAALEEAGGDPSKMGSSRDPKIKRIEKQIENMEQKLAAAFSGEGKDQNVRFDELGVDMLYVDEAHEYRKLDFTTSRQVKGLSPMGSGRAFDLYMKSRYLEEKTPGRSLVLASGTPVTNTIAELYTVQKMLGRKALEEKGIEDFDSWASMFGREKTTLEPNAAGKYEMVTRFQDFANVPELTQMFREFADVLTSDQLAEMLGDKRPQVEGGSRTIVPTPETAEYEAFRSELEQRMEESKAWKPSPEEPNNPDPVIRIIGDGRLAAIDMRFMDPKLPNNPDSKLNRMIDDVIKALKETANYEYKDKAGNVEPTKGAAAMVFSDLGFGAGVAKTRGFNARTWFEKRVRDAGIPDAQVAFMSDYKKSSAKLKLFKDVNAGRVRLLVGSSKNMGTGVNAQQRLKDMFHLDSPWFPADLEQREGRIVRQGNKNPKVRLKAFAAVGTYDQHMWGQLANKQLFIDKALSGDPSVRRIEDAGAADMMALAAGMVAKDPRVLVLAGLNAEIGKLQRLNRAHEDTKAIYRNRYSDAEMTMSWNEKRLPAAIEAAKHVQDLSGDNFQAKAGGKVIADRGKWAQALIDSYTDRTNRAALDKATVGEISGFPVVFSVDMKVRVDGEYLPKLTLETPNPVVLVSDPNTSPMSIAMRAQNAVADVARLPAKMRERMQEAAATTDALREKLNAPFAMAPLLAEKVRERDALQTLMATPTPAAGSQANDAAVPAAVEKEQTDTLWGNMQSDVAENGSTDTVTRLSRGGSGRGMDTADLAKLANSITRKNPRMPKVHVLADTSTAPKGLRDYIEAQGAQNDVEGAMHDGELYLFASGLSDPLRAEHVLAEHEAAHYGLRAILGDSVNQAMNLIYAQNGPVRKAATELQRRGRLSNAEAVEEVIVDIPTADLAQLNGWRKITAMARDWLAAHGFDAMAGKLSRWLDGSLSDQQRADLFVADLVRGARDYVAGKGSAKKGAKVAGTRLSGTLAADIERQEKWLQAEAKERGFKDVEDMLARDYPMFEKLAELWRKKNPADEGVLLSRGPDSDAYAKAVRQWQEAMSRVPSGNARPAEAGVSVEMPTPTIFKALGIKAQILALPVRYVQGIRSKHQDVPAAVFLNLPQLLSDPEMVMPYSGGGYRVMIDAKTTKGEAIVVGVSEDGRVQTITPMHDVDGVTGHERLSAALERALSTNGAKVYARNKKAPSEIRASRGVAMGTLNPNHASSTGAVPAINALHRTPRDKAIILFRDRVVKNAGEFGPGIRLSRAGTAAERADAIIRDTVGSARPLDAIARTLTRATGVDRLTGAIYDRAGALLNALVPDNVKAGIISDFGLPEAVKDQRTLLQGRQRVQLRKAGSLIEKLATLTREESRVAYEWMNMDGENPQAYLSAMDGLPEESVKVLQEVQAMIDRLSEDAVRLGQLDPEAFKRNRFAYLRRSYAKHTLEQTKGQKAKRARTIAVLGEQYKGRGLSQVATMESIKTAAPDWWKRKFVSGKADTSLKGEKLLRLERRAPSGQGTKPIEGMAGKPVGRVLDVAYWPVSERIPSRYLEWAPAGTWEVRDTKGANAVLWRDFTKDEREQMGEIDEARFAIAKTLHAMIHDVEVGRYLEWLAVKQAKKEGEEIPGEVVEASERYRDTFKPGEWVRVPDSKIAGTNTLKYGKLAGRYIDGPVWNDLRQMAGGSSQSFGDTYAKVLNLWKTAKTALSPAVHMNNVMSNFVMADWHDVHATHVSKALRILLAASDMRGGIADREAAKEILVRYSDSGGDTGTWVTTEIARDQLDPLLKSLEQEMAATNGGNAETHTGVYAALQHALHLRFASAWDAAVASKPGRATQAVGSTLLDMYQSEDDVFRLGAWLAAKEDGATDMDAGKRARSSFLDYSINAPWINAMRKSAWPFLSFTYRAVPMFTEIAARKPHKLLKLMAIAGGLNALGAMLAGGDDDKDRKLLPDEKAGSIWGMVPKLVRMPWNDAHGSPVYLDIRRFIPVGDVFDIGQGQSAVPILPGLQPGGPLVIAAEVLLNKSAFTGKPITLETDTPEQKASKVFDHFYKAFAPNVLGLPGTYATTGVAGSLTGRTDAFGRELSTPQALASSFGVKLGSYPPDVMRRNLMGKFGAEKMEIDRNISQFKRQHQTGRIDNAEYQRLVTIEQDKKRKLMDELGEKLN